MLQGWGRIWRTKLNVVKCVYLSLNNAAARSKYISGYKALSGQLLLVRVPGLVISNVKSGEHSITKLQIWNLLRWLGVDHCKLVVFRRNLKRFTYPWLGYSLPIGLILGLGDFIAQYHLAPHPSDRTISDFLNKDWIKERTLVFVLLGMFLVGPMLCKWDLFWYRKLRCKAGSYFITKLLVDLLLLSPLLLALMAVIFDQRYGVNIFTDSKEATERNFHCKYKPAIVDIMKFNLLTRPAMALLMCYVIPKQHRKSLRFLYEIIFATYISDAFYRHKLRFEPPPPPPPPPPEPPEHRTPCTKAPPRPSRRAFRWPC